MRAVVAALFAGVATADVTHPAPDLPAGWGLLAEPVALDHAIELRLSLKQTNLNQVLDIAQQVSNPRSKSYGEYMTSDELASLTAPTAQHRAAVENWLIGAKITFERVGHNMLEVKASTYELKSLLKTDFYHLSNSETGQQKVQAGTYELPENVDDAIAAVYGMHGFPLPESAPTEKGPAQVTPAVIKKTYGISGVKPSGSEKNRQAVAEFQGQAMRPSDLGTFFKKYVHNAPPSAAAVHEFVPNKRGTGVGIEASLDIQYIMGVAPGLLTDFWSQANADFCGDLQKWSSLILSTSDVPLVHSVSYGWQGNLSQIGCKKAQVADIDTNFAKLAVKGITIIFASGDSGSGYSDSLLYPSWPASSPWVTAVGATRFENQTVGHPEMASDQFGSGGGFSTMFDAFDAQKSAVAKYFKTAGKLPAAGSFPPSGRATPDVAALGEGYQVVVDGHVTPVGGTSASAPTFAGIVSLLNEARIKAGKPPMGYLNTFLYQNPDAFTDITVGTNSIGRDGGKQPGFPCAKGWDPVTGLGTPLFSKLLSAAMAKKESPEVIVV